MSAEYELRGTAGRIRIVTKCRTVDELAERFAALVERDSIFVLPPTPVAIGEHREFVVLLDDGTVALAGRGEVTDPNAQLGGRTGARLRFIDLEPDTRTSLELILAAKQRPQPASSAPPDSAVPRPLSPSIARTVRVSSPPPPPIAATRRPSSPPPIAASHPTLPPQITVRLRALPRPFRTLAAAPACPVATAVPQTAVEAPTVPLRARPVTAAPPEAVETPTVRLRARAVTAAPPEAVAAPVAIDVPAAAEMPPAIAAAIVAAPIVVEPEPRDRSMPYLRLIRGGRSRIAMTAISAVALSALVVTFAFGSPGGEETRGLATFAVAGHAAVPAADVERPTAVAPSSAIEPSPALEPSPEARPVRRKAAPRTRVAKKVAATKVVKEKQRPVARTPRPAGRSAGQSAQVAQLSLTSSPPGATFVVNGKALDRGANHTTVPASTTVKVTAVLRGHKRTTRTIQVGKGASVVIQLERIGWGG